MLALAIQSHWRSRTVVSWLLFPLSLLYQLAISIRKRLYRYGVIESYRAPVPVIVVGNITVGGSGKTPLVIWLAQFLKQQGWAPGIVSRGYGGKSSSSVQQVSIDSDPREVGDEAVMIHRRSSCEVFISADRPAAIRHMLAQTNCNVVITDDGLQHLAMERDVEVAVVDSVSRFGNGFCLPAGPLREPVKRLDSVDAIVVNGVNEPGRYSMHLRIDKAISLLTGEERSLQDMQEGELHAVAGIGHPQRFFTQLENIGLNFSSHAFPDHHLYSKQDFSMSPNATILMTEKDAVKCEAFADQRMWLVPLTVDVDLAFADFIQDRLRRVKYG